jgi:hypothetical protein
VIAGRVAGEQRLDVERLWRRDHEIYAVARNVHARQLVHNLIDLGDDNACLESGRFDDRRRVLRIRTHVQITLAIGAAGHAQCNVGGEVDEIAGEQLDVGVDRAELDLSRLQDARHCVALRTRKGKVKLLCNALLEEVDVLGQHDAGLHDVQVVQHFRIGFGQTGSQKVRLLLVVAFEADTIFGPDHRLEQRGRVVWRYYLSRCEFAPRGETFAAGSLLALPISHVVQPVDVAMSAPVADRG